MEENELSEELMEALDNYLLSKNESDSNGEIANITDGLFAIARAIDRLAKSIKER